MVEVGTKMKAAHLWMGCAKGVIFLKGSMKLACMKNNTRTTRYLVEQRPFWAKISSSIVGTGS